VLAALAWLLCACGSKPTLDAPQRAQLVAGVVASVGDQEIRDRSVAAIAKSRGWSLERARDAAIADALFAAEAREAMPDEVRAAEQRVLSRALLHHIWRDANSAPVSDDELEHWTMRGFVEFDRPPGWRVVHAVVLVPADAAQAEQERARAHAEEIRRSAAPIVREAALVPPLVRKGDDAFIERSDAPQDEISERFRKLVTQMDHGKLDTRFESLGVISDDGRHVDLTKSPYDRIVIEFSRAAAMLRERGELSPVVETQFETSDGQKLRGFHVIALLERTEEKRMAREARLAALSHDILMARARRAHRELVTELRRRARIEIARNAEALMADLRIEANASPAAP
jgi:peptidyl-prolyl cis-trans isomerase C